MNDERQPAAAAEADADITSEDTPIGAPKWFRIVAIIAIVWNLMGCASFVFHLLFTEAMMKDMTPEKQEWVKSVPGWIYIFFFLSVAPGTLGSIGLLVRKAWATPLFAVSLVSVVIQMGYTMFIVEGSDVLGAGDKIMSLVVIALAAVLLWLSMHARKQGWMSS